MTAAGVDADVRGPPARRRAPRLAAAGAHARGIEGFLTEHGAVAVMESRIVPVLPFGVVNFSAGLTSLPYRDLALGTVVGAAPKVFAYVALGGSLSDLGSPEAIVAVALLVALRPAGRAVVGAGSCSAAPNLPRVSYFQAVRLYSLVEVCIFTALVVTWSAASARTPSASLGWTHGFGWILLCLLVAHGCRRGIFPWPLLAATVSPLGPGREHGGLEYWRRRRRQPRTVASAACSRSTSRTPSR